MDKVVKVRQRARKEVRWTRRRVRVPGKHRAAKPIMKRTQRSLTKSKCIGHQPPRKSRWRYRTLSAQCRYRLVLVQPLYTLYLHSSVYHLHRQKDQRPSPRLPALLLPRRIPAITEIMPLCGGSKTVQRKLVLLYAHDPPLGHPDHLGKQQY